MIVIFVVLGLLFAWAGRLARRSWWQPLTVFAAHRRAGPAWPSRSSTTPELTDLLPVLVGFVTWVVCLSVLTDALRSEERRAARAAAAGPRRPGRRLDVLPRRGFLIGAGLMAVASRRGRRRSAGSLGQGRRHVEETRRLLRLPGVSRARRRRRASRWASRASPRGGRRTTTFYLIHTALIPPAIEPKDWQLRIHGMVDREVVLTYADLMARELTEAWVTLNCVSNPVGGTLIGNAWWSGVRARRPAARGRASRTAPTPCCRPPTTAGPAARRSPR